MSSSNLEDNEGPPGAEELSDGEEGEGGAHDDEEEEEEIDEVTRESMYRVTSNFPSPGQRKEASVLWIRSSVSHPCYVMRPVTCNPRATSFCCRLTAMNGNERRRTLMNGR